MKPVTKAYVLQHLRRAEVQITGVTDLIERGNACERVIQQMQILLIDLANIQRLVLNEQLELCFQQLLQNPHDTKEIEEACNKIAALYQVFAN